MTDRELLELAAKAAGIDIDHWTEDRDRIPVAVYAKDNGGAVFWQPLLVNRLTDCMGDALRLAVKLRFEIDIHHTGIAVRTPTGIKVLVDAADEPDANAATRRAILRAAAAIGQAMP